MGGENLDRNWILPISQFPIYSCYLWSLTRIVYFEGHRILEFYLWYELNPHKYFLVSRGLIRGWVNGHALWTELVLPGNCPSISMSILYIFRWSEWPNLYFQLQCFHMSFPSLFSSKTEIVSLLLVMIPMLVIGILLSMFLCCILVG